MVLNIDIGYEQLLQFIRQLPFPEKKRLFKELHKEVEQKEKDHLTSLQKLLLDGPTWTDEEYEQFMKTKDQLNRFAI